MNGPPDTTLSSSAVPLLSRTVTCTPAAKSALPLWSLTANSKVAGQRGDTVSISWASSLPMPPLMYSTPCDM
jgi:hypothetical protein